MAGSRRRGGSRGGGRGRGKGKSEDAPHVELRRFAEALANGLPAVVVLRGEERWYRERALRDLLACVAETDLYVKPTVVNEG